MDNFFESASAKLEEMETVLNSAAARLQGFPARLRAVSAQVKRNISVRDADLEGDFNATAKELYDFASASEEFWAATRETVRGYSKKDLAENHAFEIKSFNVKARMLTRSIEDVASRFAEILRAANGAGLKLNLWMLEAASLNLDKLAGKILFMSRSLSKILEAEK